MIEIHPREPQVVRVGESAMLSCRAIAGIPAPNVVWVRRDNSPLTQRIKEEYPGTILITDITLAEDGEYECKASNVAGEVSQSASITVHQPPTIQITPNQNEITITEGDELKLECVSDGIPAPSVQWKTPESFPATRTYAGAPVFSPQAVIHKYNAVRSDEGVYVCHASNRAGSDEKYITVIVQPKRGDVGTYSIT